MIKRSMVRQVLALGIALLVVGMGLSGCARRVSVSFRIVSSYSGKGVSGATVTFGSSGDSQSSLLTGRERSRDRFRQIGYSSA